MLVPLLTRVRRWRVIVIGLFVYVCVCVCVTANLCGILLKTHDPCEGKSTLSLVRESRKLFDGRDTTVQRQKNANFCPSPYFLSHGYPFIIHVLDSNMHSLPKRLNSIDKQSVCVCLFLHNLGECFFSILVVPIAGKNLGPSNK